MFKSSLRDTPWARIARGTLAVLLDGTGCVLVLTATAVEFCGECLQDLATRVAGAPRPLEPDTPTERVVET